MSDVVDFRPIDTSGLQAPAKVDAGAAPMLQWIEIKDLVVDDLYQRAPIVRSIQSIADAFDWRKFSPVVVSPIEGGRFAIIDGQHRCHAAAACGIERVPCQVTIMDRAEQARAFAAINGQATKVHSLTMFKAAIAACEAWAIELRDTAAAADCHAMTMPRALQLRKPGDIQSIGMLRKLVAERGRQKVETALQIVRRTDGLGCDVETYNLNPLAPLLNAITTRPHVLKNPDEATVALAYMDVDKLRSEADALRRDRLRSGLPSMGVADLLETAIGDALDKALSKKAAA